MNYLLRSVYILTLILYFNSCEDIYSLGELEAPIPAARLSRVYLTGACKVGNYRLELSVILANQPQGSNLAPNIIPTSRLVNMEQTSVSELINSGSFTFNPPPIMQRKIENAELEDAPAYVETEDGLTTGNPYSISLSPVRVEYQWASKDPEAGRIPLLILLMDQSNSVLGLSRSMQTYGSDYTNHRIDFFKGLIKFLEPSFSVAMITFSDTSSSYDDELSQLNTPVINRDLINSELENLRFSNTYQPGTPLNQALADTKSMIKSLEPNTYDPVVVVFTDGLEGKDNSVDAPAFDDLASFFINERIPVHTIQLQAKQDDAGDPEEEIKRPQPLVNMSELACATGGDFYFLRSADEFSNNYDLLHMLRNRLSGRWSLLADTDFSGIFEPSPTSGLMLTTQVEVTLSGEFERFNAAQTDLSSLDYYYDSYGDVKTTDNRLWILNKD